MNVDPEVLREDIRRQKAKADAIAERAHAKLGVERATRRETRLSAEQRAAAERAKRGPLSWLFVGSSPEEVVRDSTLLKQVMRIYKTRPRMRHGGRTTITLPSGRTVRFHSRSGEVTPR